MTYVSLNIKYVQRGAASVKITSLRRVGVTEGAGAVYAGEKAQEGPYCSLQLPERKLYPGRLCPLYTFASFKYLLYTFPHRFRILLF